MRTRFLNIDYLAPSITGTLSFLNLPIPHLPPSDLSNSDDDYLIRLDSLPIPNIEIAKLPIDSALSKFISDVTPDFIGHDHGDFEVNSSGNGNNGSNNKWSSSFASHRLSEKEMEPLFEENEVESHTTSVSEKMKNVEDEKRLEIIQFETPELDIFLENACPIGKEYVPFFSEILELENDLDTIKKEVGMQLSDEVQQALYSVDFISSDNEVEQKHLLLEEKSPSRNQTLLQDSGFPLLEVNDISLTILPRWLIEDEVIAVLQHIEPQNWDRKDNFLTDGKELLGSVDCDLLELIADGFHSKDLLESELASFGILKEIDIMNMMQISHTEGSYAFNPLGEDVRFSSVNLVTFEEYQIFDVVASGIFEDFLCTQTTSNTETCDSMFGENLNFKNFNELIVSQELVLSDDTFRSLPIPILSGHENVLSPYSTIEKILSELTPQALPASDEIYLDWHLLDKDKCNHKISSAYSNVSMEMDPCNINLDWIPPDDGELVFDYIFSEGTDIEIFKESSDALPDGVSMLGHYPIEVDSRLRIEGKCPRTGKEEHPSDTNTVRETLLHKSMSTFDDLDFFLNPGKAAAGGSTGSAVVESQAHVTLPESLSSDSKPSIMSMGMQLKQWDVSFYNVKLSREISALLENFDKRYLAILQNETELTSFLEEDNIKLLSIPKENLMKCIKKKILRRTNSSGDENIMAFVMLCAIKQMAWYMCFYGIHVMHLYLHKLSQILGSFEPRLGLLYSVTQSAFGKLDKEVTGLHPSLSVIKEILQSNNGKNSFKALLLADLVFWCSLKRLLLSMGLSCTELASSVMHGNHPNMFEATHLTSAGIEDLLISDCLLVTHEFISLGVLSPRRLVSASFPFDKFSLVLEYGGSFDSSRISSALHKLARLPRLHFIKVELDKVSGALCEGVGVSQIRTTREKEFHSIKALDEIMKDQRLEELLNYVPLEDTSNMISLEAAQDIDPCFIPLPSALEPELIQTCTVSIPDAVIIVNTQNVDKEKIFCRRSTYEKILGMEKKGVQVVERDIDMPVDLILSCATCLVWYDCRNIRQKKTVLSEAPSSLHLCIENIAANVLTLLSFSFSCCVLVFEGESTFLSAVMESSNELYAAAASLGIDLQLFCSYSANLTDEIILKCIENAVKLTRGLYPKMTESETLVESFLSTFPSVNPLTAHAILSSGYMLNEFLNLSRESRITKLHNYYVPDESVDLLSASCKFGEREDSKSIMTDCSSSVSSGPDTDTYSFSNGRVRKQQKCNESTDLYMDDLFHFDQLNQITDGTMNSIEFEPYECCLPKDAMKFDKNRKPNCLLDDLMGQKQTLDFTCKPNPNGLFRKQDSHYYKDSHILDFTKKWDLPSDNKLLGHSERSERPTIENWDWQNIGNLDKDFIGEVINGTYNSSGEDFSSTKNFMSFSPLMPDVGQCSTRKPYIARRLSYDEACHPSFPTADEINCASDLSASLKDSRQNFQAIGCQPVIDGNNTKFPLKRPRSLLEEVRAASSIPLPFEEEISHCCRTPLSKAILSSPPTSGSPWKIEFLNKIRERSKVRQQALPCQIGAPSANAPKATKRKSPSILDFFRYQGGSIHKKISNQKKQKLSVQFSSSAKKGKTSGSALTPIDKRARQSLSFATNGSGSQTKLVWSEEHRPHALDKKN